MNRIVVGVDGSEHARRAVQWCADHAKAFGAEVIAVHVMETPVPLASGAFYAVPSLGPEEREELREVIATKWCKPLADAGVEYQVRLMDGGAALALIQAADSEDAALVVVGRRGLGGFAEFWVGSTSHQLTHHLGRPLVIIP